MVSNNNLGLNLALHILVIFSIILLFYIKNVKIKKYVLEGTILVLYLTVVINAINFGNPFHIITFDILAIITGYVLVKGKSIITVPQKGIRTYLALMFILLGIWYPELVNTNIFNSLLLSPVGVVPCPTLITVFGMLNLFYKDINKKYFSATVLFGIVYGFIGTFKLGVNFDICLIGAVVFSIYNIISYYKLEYRIL